MPEQMTSPSTPWPWRVITFFFWYVKEFVKANIQVTLDVLRPKSKQKMSPAILAIPAASRSETEWTLISCLITLTPGTLTLSISREHQILYVHGMFVHSREETAGEIQEMEDRMIGALRRRPGDLSRPLEAPVVVPSDEPQGGDHP